MDWNNDGTFIHVAEHCPVGHGVIPQPRGQAPTIAPHLRAEFFGKPTACLRASPLVKTYGWGLHFDADGRVALPAMEGKTYRRVRSGADQTVTVLAAMRSKRR